MVGTQHAARILVASNRGPVSYALGDDGELTSRRGGGGLVSGLSAIGPDAEAVWVCAALSDGDREAVRRGVGEDGVRMIAVERPVFEAAYNGIANSVLWFVHHLLYQTPLEPVFDEDFRGQWASYQAYNAAFADALAQEADRGAAVVVQDYHLSLVPAMLRERRPDLRIGHFTHTPWAPPDYFRLLPDDVAEEVLGGILGADRAASSPAGGRTPSRRAARRCWAPPSPPRPPGPRSPGAAAPPGSGCTGSGPTATSCGSGRTGRTWPSGSPRCGRRPGRAAS